VQYEFLFSGKYKDPDNGGRRYSADPPHVQAFCLRIHHSRMRAKYYVGGVGPAFGPMNLFSGHILFQDTCQLMRKPNLKDLKDNVQRKWKPSSEIAETAHNSTVMTRYSST